jgi:hypothetical protein
VSSTRQFHQPIAPGRRLHARPWDGVICQPCIAYRVGEGEQIIGARFRLFLDGESDHFPAARRRQGLGVGLAEVIAVRLDLICQRPENRRGIPIGIGQRRGGRIGASCSRTATRPHLPDGTPRAGSIVGSARPHGVLIAPASFGKRCTGPLPRPPEATWHHQLARGISCK